MANVRYLSVLDVEALHAFIMEKMGAHASVRDRGLLESAILRPQNAAFYSNADLNEQCALLAAGICQAQAFSDGNKRTAFMAADVFLRLNGHIIVGDQMGLATHLESLATREVSEEEATTRLAEWLRHNVREVA